MSVQMSVSEILGSVEGLERNKFEQLYRELFALRAKKNNIPRLNEVESQLLSKINTEFDEKKWESLKAGIDYLGKKDKPKQKKKDEKQKK